MLVLTRNDEQAVQIGDDIRVVLLKGKNGSARIGFEAPPDIQIVREELLQPVEQPTFEGSVKRAD